MPAGTTSGDWQWEATVSFGEGAEVPVRVYSLPRCDVEVALQDSYEGLRREELLPLLEWLPCKSLVRVVLLCDGAAVPDHVSPCTIQRSAAWVVLPDARHDDRTLRRLLHGWAHQAMEKYTKQARFYEHAARLEEHGPFVCEAASYDLHENWAYHFSEALLAEDAAFEGFLQESPFRAVALGRALERALRDGEFDGGVHGERWRRRAQLIADEVVPVARRTLAALLDEGPRPGQEASAIRLAFYLGPPESRLWARLEELDLAYEPLNEGELAALSPDRFPLLRAVDLSGTSIGKSGLSLVEGFQHLKSLGAADTLIDNLRPIAGLEWLELLDLSRSRVRDSSLTAILRCKRLAELRVDGTAVTPLGRETVRAHLPGCRVLGD